MIQDRLVLLGLSHAGKTTTGKLLAASLGRPFYDTDVLIQLQSGVTPRELCRTEGVAALHRAEAAALRSCCTAVPGVPAAAIIAAGGGICDNREAAAVLAGIPHRVFLYAAEAVLFDRITRDALQTGYYPAFLQFLPVAEKSAAKQAFALLYARRTAYYRRCCTVCIDTVDLPAAAVAEKIMTLV